MLESNARRPEATKLSVFRSSVSDRVLQLYTSDVTLIGFKRRKSAKEQAKYSTFMTNDLM